MYSHNKFVRKNNQPLNSDIIQHITNKISKSIKIFRLPYSHVNVVVSWLTLSNCVTFGVIKNSIFILIFLNSWNFGVNSLLKKKWLCFSYYLLSEFGSTKIRSWCIWSSPFCSCALNFGYNTDDGILRGSVAPFMHFAGNAPASESKQSLGQFSDHIDKYRDVAL